MRLLQETPMTRPIRWLLAPVLLAALSACGGDADDAARRDAGASGPVSDLPAPEGAVGSVTGMPEHPGPGTVPLALGGTRPTAPTSTATGSGTRIGTGETGTMTGPGIVTGTAQGDAAAAIDDGGLDRMAVATDFPDPPHGDHGTSAAASEPVPPIVIVNEPRETVPSTMGTTIPSDDAQDDDAD